MNSYFFYLWPWFNNDFTNLFYYNIFVHKSETFFTILHIVKALSTYMKGRKMQLNKTTDYAVRILVFLSRKSDFVSADEISRATSISKNYTIKILRILTSEEIVKMKRGIKGGFLLISHLAK